MSAGLAELVNRSANQLSGRRSRRTNSSWSGASILGGRITIVTVTRADDGTWSIDPLKSAEFPRAERDQASIRQLHAVLDQYLSRARISEVFLRLGAGAGPHNAKAESHICEAILALLLGVRLHHVSAFSLTPWLRAKHQVISCQAAHRSWQFALSAAQYAAETECRVAGDTAAESGRPSKNRTRSRANIRARIGNSELFQN